WHRLEAPEAVEVWDAAQTGGQELPDAVQGRGNHEGVCLQGLAGLQPDASYPRRRLRTALSVYQQLRYAGVAEDLAAPLPDVVHEGFVQALGGRAVEEAHAGGAGVAGEVVEHGGHGAG